MTSQIRLLLSWYELHGQQPVAEEELADMRIEAILALFAAPFWNGVYQCWAVEQQHVAALQPHVQHVIELHSYDYFVEAIRFDQ